MEAIEVSNHFILETRYWFVGHRRDARYPRYLMVSSREQQPDLCHLTSGALMELGCSVLKGTEELLHAAYKPFKALFYKLGFSPGFNCHFHVAPVTPALRYEVIQHFQYDNDPDDNDVILFASRIYCERGLTHDRCTERHQHNPPAIELTPASFGTKCEFAKHRRLLSSQQLPRLQRHLPFTIISLIIH